MTRLLLWALLFALPAGAQEKKTTPEAQKKAAAAAMTAAGVKDATVVESAHLVFASALPEAKAKAVVETLEKVHALGTKALRFEGAAADEPKTTVFAFGDVDAFRGYVRTVLKRSPDKDEFTAIDAKSDGPVVAVSAKRGEKTPNYEALISPEITNLLLKKKGGNSVIDGWMKDGFYKAVMSRIDAKVGAAEKAKLRTLAKPLPKGAKITYTVVEKAWWVPADATMPATPPADKDAVGMSLMEFFTFGPGHAKFGQVLSGLIPVNNRDTASMTEAVKNVDWTDGKEPAKVDPKAPEPRGPEGLERVWRGWVSKGSPPAKDGK